MYHYDCYKVTGAVPSNERERSVQDDSLIGDLGDHIHGHDANPGSEHSFGGAAPKTAGPGA